MQTSVRVEQGRLVVQGPLLMDHARTLRDAVLAQFNAPETVIDLAQASNIDSSAVALLLEWRREAQQRGISLRIVNAPGSVRTLGELYGVTEWLGLAT